MPSEKKVTPIVDQKPTDVIPFTELTQRVAGEFAIEPAALWAALKTEFFPGGAASDAQMFLVLQIMDKYKLNPFMHEMFAAISQKTGKLLVGIQYDGFNTIAHRNPHYRGYKMEHERDPKTNKVIAVTCKVYRDDWEHPGEYYALMDEWFVKGKDTWDARPVHQLSIKAFNNCVKLTLGLTGLYDSDDIERIQDAEKPKQRVIETTARSVDGDGANQSKGEDGEKKISGGTTKLDTAPSSSGLRPETQESKATAGPAGQQPVGEVIPETRQPEANRAGEAVTEPTQGDNSAPDNNPTVRAKLAKLVERTAPARLNLLLGQQGVSKVEDLNEEQAAYVVRMLSKGAK